MHSNILRIIINRWRLLIIKSDDGVPYPLSNPAFEHHDSGNSNPSRFFHTFPSGRVYQLDQMTKVDMMSRIYQLERANVCQRSKIQALTESLSALRRTVEGATTVMASDALVPVRNGVSLFINWVSLFKNGVSLIGNGVSFFGNGLVYLGMG